MALQEQEGGDPQEEGREGVRAHNHRLAPHHVEEPGEQDGAQEVAAGEGEHVDTPVGGLYVLGRGPERSGPSPKSTTPFTPASPGIW